MARVLGIGVATYDVINTVETYPPEDAKVRIIARRVARGGNAANTLEVLSRLGHRCSWGGVLARDAASQWIMDELRRCGVETRHGRITADGTAPTSYILLSRATGSRTIAHYRDLPEFGDGDFAAIDLSDYDWIHFEGRNIAATEKMLQSLALRHRRAVCSVEVERPREDIERLFDHADVLLFSRDYVRGAGWGDAPAFLAHMHRRLPQRRMVCTWGEEGAYGVSPDGEVVHSPARPPPVVVETVGAGDTFNAGVIHTLAGGGALAEALETGCRLAGAKCGRVGFDLTADQA
jgi:ketohexokinase